MALGCYAGAVDDGARMMGFFKIIQLADISV